jgi:hypothetical protein
LIGLAGGPATITGTAGPTTGQARFEAGREWIPSRLDPLTSHPSSRYEDEPAAIPLSTAEKPGFAPENFSVTDKNLFYISRLNVIRPTRATAEIGCTKTGSATDRQRNSAAYLDLAESAHTLDYYINKINMHAVYNKASSASHVVPASIGNP